MMLKIRYYKNFIKVSRTFTSGSVSSKRAKKFAPKLEATSPLIKWFSDWVSPVSDDKFISKESHHTDLLKTEEDENLNIQEKCIYQKGERSDNSHIYDDILNKAINTLCQETVVNTMSGLWKSLPSAANSLSSIYKRKDFRYLLSEVEKFYPKMNGYELVRILHYMVSMGLADNKSYGIYVTKLLKILTFHLNNLSASDILNLNTTLLKMSNCGGNVESIIFCLPILMEKQLQEVVLSKFELQDLVFLCRYCARCNVKDTYKVFEELGERTLSNQHTISILWTILDLPFSKPFFKFMISPQKEIIIEILAKECLTFIINNIKTYSPAMLLRTLDKMGNTIRSKKDIAYHEIFFQQVSRRAVEEDWNFQQMSVVVNTQYHCNYVNEKLLHRIAEDLPRKHEINMKMISLLLPFSTMDEQPRCIEYFINTLEKQAFGTMTVRPGLLTVAASILSMGYSPKILLQNIFNPVYIQNIFRNPSMGRKWAKPFLLLNLCMEKDPSLAAICLSEGNKTLAINYLRESKTTSRDPLNLQNIVENPSNYISGVLYRQGILIHYLLVVDETGRLVSWDKNSDPTFNESFCLYEDLNINVNHRRIAILDMPEGFIVRPGMKWVGIAKLSLKILESEGFEVIPYRHAQYESEQKLKQIISQFVSPL